jgi:hypothetical protein
MSPAEKSRARRGCGPQRAARRNIREPKQGERLRDGRS